jgi:uridine kinase
MHPNKMEGTVDKMTVLREVTIATTDVAQAEPRQTVQIALDDGRIFEGPVGTTLEQFFRVAYPDPPAPVVGALVNERLRELSFEVLTDIKVTPITMGNSDGMRIYRRSLSFLLVVAVHELFPGTRLFVDHSFTFGGYFCQVEGREPFTPQELERLEQRMWEIVEGDEPIIKERIPLQQAQALFRAMGHEDRLRLLKYRHKDYLTIYKLRGVSDYFYGYMVPSTGYLCCFELQHYHPGFILRFPRRHQPTVLQPYRDYPKLVAVFREYGEWMSIMDVRDMGGLNEAFERGRARELILVAEALHEQRIARIAQQIAERRGEVRLVLIAGPSSSGKTTFSKRLAIQLLANGIRPKPLELDSYFVDREETPLDEQGNFDFESLGALDLELFNRQLLELMAGREVTLPQYNFRTGLREGGETVQLCEDHIILAEGIHGLNPRLVPQVPPERIFRIYVSALTQLNIDMHNRVPTTDTRLIRRIVRDATYRGYSATATINRWESVRRGEKLYIFPYQEHADVMFNSALVYELPVLKPFAEPLLRQIDPWSTQHNEARRLLAFLEWCQPCQPDLVPDNSILREFIGGSILRDFRL